MKTWEVMRLFETNRQLLLMFEPHEAMEWWMREQPMLMGQRPCALIETMEGYELVQQAVRQLLDSAHA